MTFELCNIDWTAISAIATLVMAIATFFTLKQNAKQLKELKRQWQNDHKAIIEISLVHPLYEIRHNINICLEVRNLGAETAENVIIGIPDDFLNGFPIMSVQRHAKEILGKTYRILPKEHLLLNICYVSTFNHDEYIFEDMISENDYMKVQAYLLKQSSFPVTCNYSCNGTDYSIERVVSIFDVSQVQLSTDKQLAEISKQLSNINNKLHIE